MSKYKEIKGFKVQTLATDTAASVAATGSWSSGGDLNTARTHMGQAGTRTASLVFAGNTPPSSQLTEKYDGTSWTVANTMTETARDQVYSFGTQTAAICASGVTGVDGAKSKLVEEWGGVSWTAGTDNNTARQAGASAGASQTSGIMYGGSADGSHKNLTESWNGNSWTQVGVLNTAGSYIAGGGTQTSALCSVGGGRPAQNESWNGSSWSEISEQNTFRDQSGGAADSNTLGLIYGGEAPPYTAKTEAWDGTTWTEVSDLATATGIGSGGSGGQTGGPSSALAVGGQAGPGARVATTQEWTTPSASFMKLNQGQVYYNSGSNAFKVTQQLAPAGTWSSGGSMSTARAQVAGAGSQGAGIVAGGSGPPPGSQNAELYNGSTWAAAGGNLSGIARRLQAGTGGGSQNSAISIGGYSAPPSPNGTLNLVEKWDGSSWSEVSEISTARYQAMGGGASNQSAITAGGETAAAGETANTEVWDNSSWTESGNLSSARTQCAGGGPVTSAMCVSQSGSPKGIVSIFNGSSWSDVTELNTDRQAVMAMISNDTAGTVAGGTGPASPNSALTETWNGTAWTEVADLASGRYNGTGVGTSVEGFVAGGGTSATGTTTTEEWTVPVSNKTITAS